MDDPSSKSIYVFFFFSFLFAKDIASHHASHCILYCIDLVMSIKVMIQIQIQIQAVILNTNRSIYFWLRSFNTGRETQIIKVYANHTMLTPSPLPLWHILWCLRSLPVDTTWYLNWSDLIWSVKPSCAVQWSNILLVFSKSSNSQDISSGHDVIPTLN